MNVIESISEFRKHHPRCVATIGKFDGVHIGHQAIVGQLLARAAQHAAPAVVIIIEPHPEEFFAGNPDDCPARLSEVEEKIGLLADRGVDHVHILHFNRSLSQLSAEQYIESILVDGFGVKALIVGDDFRFGHRRSGDFALLQRYGREFDFEVIRTDSCDHDGERVSSTLVREVLARGEFARAGKLLGRPYAITGKVVKGQQLGRNLGFPTCNVRLNRQTIPLQGVYACEVVLADEPGMEVTLRGAANIGYRPSVGSAHGAVLEVHLLDFRGDLYDETISVIFRHRVRDEIRFGTLDELRDQIADDVNRVRDWFAATDNSDTDAISNTDNGNKESAR